MINERIKLIRLQKSKNSGEFAKSTGFEARTYASYERGERNPSLEFLQKLVEKYNVNINWLLTGEGQAFFENDYVEKNEKTNYILKNPKKAIQKLRAENDLTLSEFSKITGIDETILIDCINEERELPVKSAVSIVNNFNISLDDLYLQK